MYIDVISLARGDIQLEANLRIAQYLESAWTFLNSRKKKTFTVYGNCQAPALARHMLENKEFKKQYFYLPIKAVHNVSNDDVKNILDTLSKVDLLIYQNISSNYRISVLSTDSVLKVLRDDCIKISFPSLHFNGYFPHLDKFNNIVSVTNLVHDYNILYCFSIGMNEKETIEMITSDDFYDYAASKAYSDEAFHQLQKREKEQNVDLPISDFIKQNYLSWKLFNQFNHPKRIVFEHIRNCIFALIGIPTCSSENNNKGYLDRIELPIYKSTHRNLSLAFEDDHETYSTLEGKLYIDEVVEKYFQTYKGIPRDEIDFALSNKQLHIEWISPRRATRKKVSQFAPWAFGSKETISNPYAAI